MEISPLPAYRGVLQSYMIQCKPGDRPHARSAPEAGPEKVTFGSEHTT